MPIFGIMIESKKMRPCRKKRKNCILKLSYSIMKWCFLNGNSLGRIV